MALTFFAIGDWGKNYDRIKIETTEDSPQMRVANAMYASMDNVQFVVSIGDMFYTRKNKELNEDFKETIHDPTTQKLRNIQNNSSIKNKHVDAALLLQTYKGKRNKKNAEKSKTIDTQLLSSNRHNIDILVEQLYENIWYTYYSKLNLDWFGVLGNHEYNYGVAYTESILNFSKNLWDNNKCFKISETIYYEIFEDTLIIFINTADLIRRFEEKKKKKDKENEKKKEKEKEVLFNFILWEIIEQCVDNVACKNIVIVGHHPIISHRHKDKKAGHHIIQKLFRKIVEILDLRNIPDKLKGYICGHEHNYQDIDITLKQSKTLKQSITFKQIITGSGGEETDPIFDCRDIKHCRKISHSNTIQDINKSLHSNNVPSDFDYKVIDLQTGYGCAKITVNENILKSEFIPAVENMSKLNANPNVTNLGRRLERTRAH